jgi:hypothetical protein
VNLLNVARSAVPALGITRLQRTALNWVYQLGIYPTANRAVIPRMGYAGVFHQVNNEGAYRGETGSSLSEPGAASRNREVAYLDVLR